MFRRTSEQQKASCPFNSNHIFAKEKLIYHMARCKDKPKVMHLMAQCRYNGLHYVKKEDIELHQDICPDKQAVINMTAMMRRNYENISDYHRERDRSRDKHKREEK